MLCTWHNGLTWLLKGPKTMKKTLTLILAAVTLPVCAGHHPAVGLASWYGEAHRGKLMADGNRFNPDHLTAASWFYPLGTRVRVTLYAPSGQPARTVVVRITDRGPAKHLVNQGRIIDLGEAAFRKLADPNMGLVPVTVRPERRAKSSA